MVFKKITYVQYLFKLNYRSNTIKLNIKLIEMTKNKEPLKKRFFIMKVSFFCKFSPISTLDQQSQSHDAAFPIVALLLTGCLPLLRRIRIVDSNKFG